MDPPEPSDGSGGRGEGGKALKVLFRCCFGFIFSLAASFLFAFLFGFVAIGIGSFSESHPVSVPARCRIVSSNVDIRSSKVCELGLLNYKAKRVFYPLEKRRFRCHFDYYWASVFEVEYKEYISGQILHGVVEAPKEALPLDCRPSFGTAWLTKMKFKINETYDCKYLLGSRKADLHSESLFNCQAEDPSLWEMTRRFFILFMRSSFSFPSSFSFNKGSHVRKMAYTVVGVVSGMLASMCLIIVIKILRASVLAMSRHLHARKLQVRVFVMRFRAIGLKQLLVDYSLGERAVTRPNVDN